MKKKTLTLFILFLDFFLVRMVVLAVPVWLLDLLATPPDPDPDLHIARNELLPDRQMLVYDNCHYAYDNLPPFYGLRNVPSPEPPLHQRPPGVYLPASYYPAPRYHTRT